MFYLIRQTNQNDIPQLAKMLEDYIQETYQGAWGGNAGLLEEHISTGDVEIIVAETSEREIVAFIASIITYDLHYCMKGSEIIDFYVSPLHRGRGAAVFLITYLAAEVQKRDGAFLKGGAVENKIVRRLYGRIAMCQPNGECYVSGRAFRHLAELSSKSLREIIKNLPETAWNYEP